MAINRASTVMRTLHRIALRASAPEQTDGQLLGRFVERRDEIAFEALVRRHGPMVLGVCRRLLRNSHDADDAFQAVFIVLVRKAASVSPRELVGNWLYGVAYQTALKARATSARRQARERQVAEMPEPEAADEDLWGDLLPVLDRELSRLPDKYRVPIVLCELEGRTHKEAARHLGCPEGTVSGRLSRARGMLAKRLARYGLAVTAGALAGALAQNGASAAVPPSLLASTVKAGTLIAAGGTAAGVLSGPVAALSKGVLKAMFVSKLQTGAAVVLTVAVIVAGVGMLSRPTADADLVKAKPADMPGRADAPPPPPAPDAAETALPFDQVSSAASVDGQVFLFVNAASGRCLSVLNGSRDNGRRVVQGPPAPDAGSSEQWKVVKVGDYFKLINVNSGRVLADPEASKERNSQMIQWDDLGIEDQQWEFVKVGRHYGLKNRASGLMLEAPQPTKDAAARPSAAGLPVVGQDPLAVELLDPNAAPRQPDAGAPSKQPCLKPAGEGLPAAPRIPVYIAKTEPPSSRSGPAPKPWYLVQNPGAAVPAAVVQSDATGRPEQRWFIQRAPAGPVP